MEIIKTDLSSQDMLNHPLFNKGTAFTKEERDELGLHGLLPYHISTIEEQAARRYRNFNERKGHLAKYSFLCALQNRNEVLFYRLVQDHISEMLPYIYTPTVGDASLQFTYLYNHNRGLYISYPLREQIDRIIHSCQENVQVIVVTDGERILGLGDLGVGGMVIPVGKLSLYTLFAGIHPAQTLPIMLDVGTNNKDLLNDPLYLGWRHKRIKGEEYEAFIGQFVKALQKKYPHVLLQWEDFGRENAKPLLEKYRHQISSFNDDIQGTAAVSLSAILSAVGLLKMKLKQQKIMILGGGSAGLGIADLILAAMCEEGLTENEAVERLFIIDIDGLVHTRLATIRPEQKRFAQSFDRVGKWTDSEKITFLDCVRHAHPTILIGVSTQKGAFTEEIVREMASHVERPIIFPLSNPTDKSEAVPEDLLKWTNGQAIIATGSPFFPVEYQGRTHYITQCNNVYIFPGVGLGVIAVRSKEVTEKMFLKAAHILAEHSPALGDPYASLFPRVEDLRMISRKVGIAVAEVAIEEGLCPPISRKELEKRIDDVMWEPRYPIFKKAAS